MKTKSVISAIIPAAGLGTRLLPATKAIPKELLPIVDTPAIQLIVEEIVSAGVNNIVFITARGKDSIMDYFDSFPQLESILSKKNSPLLDKITTPPDMANYISIRQKRPLGLGHAILAAKPVISSSHFAVLLPDDIIDNETSCIKEMIDVMEHHNASIVVALMKVKRSMVSRYGIVSGELIDSTLFKIDGMVEKPPVEESPSEFAIIGRYVFSKELFNYLEKTKQGVLGEIQLTDAMEAMISDGHKALGYFFEGKRYDTGNVLGYIEANINYALKRQDLAHDLIDILQKINSD